MYIEAPNIPTDIVLILVFAILIIITWRLGKCHAREIYTRRIIKSVRGMKDKEILAGLKGKFKENKLYNAKQKKRIITAIEEQIKKCV